MAEQEQDATLESLTLRVKPTGEDKKFSMIKDETLMENAMISLLDMNKLEVEYDFETELEQVAFSKTMLTKDISDAIEWFVNEDPLDIVHNLTHYWVWLPTLHV